LKAVMADSVQRATLLLDLHIVTSVCRPWVKACYTLEGNGACSIITWDVVQEVAGFYTLHQPNLTYPGLPQALDDYCDAVQASSFPGMSRAYALDMIKARIRRVIEPAVEYFQDMFTSVAGELSDQMSVYKTLRYVNPYSMHLNSTTLPFSTQEFISGVSALNWFQRHEIDDMAVEMPRYLALATSVFGGEFYVSRDDEMKAVQRFWAENRIRYPALRMLVKYALTIAPSSAAAERVFSLLKSTFGLNQNLALEDYMELSIMLNYNKRR